MPENLLDQIRAIEAEADRIVETARKRAAQLEAAVKPEAAALRKSHEEGLARELDSHRKELERKTDDELARLDREAARLAERLKSLDGTAESRAAELVLKHLREE